MIAARRAMRSWLYSAIALLLAWPGSAAAQDDPVTRPQMVNIAGNRLQGMPDFAISATEITFNHWDACVQGGG
jgi:hypothetical protein